jgi:hypothetical protein
MCHILIEIKSNMAICLLVSWMSRGTGHQKELSCSHLTIPHRKIWSLGQGIHHIIDRKEFENGSSARRPSWMKWVAALVIKRNLPLVTPNQLQTNLIDWPYHIIDKQIRTWLLWWQSWMSSGAGHRKSSSGHPQNHRKIRVFVQGAHQYLAESKT